MAEPKTQRTKASVAQFIAAVEDDTRRKDAKVVDKMLREITGETPAMWGATMIGYGSYTNVNTLGEANWFRLGFSPRKTSLVLYVITGEEKPALMKKLGKHKTGKSCLYINKLADVDEIALRDLIKASWNYMEAKYP